MGRQNIQEMWRRGKSLLDHGVGEWGLFLAIILALGASFGLGRLSALIDAKPLIEVSRAPLVEEGAMMGGGQYVASRTGTVYYFPWCSGVAAIQPENERWFATKEAAEKAGYRPAKNCKGLAE